jgi:hypothetical protein
VLTLYENLIKKYIIKFIQSVENLFIFLIKPKYLFTTHEPIPLFSRALGQFEARLQCSNSTLAQNKSHHQKPSISSSLQPKREAKFSASRLPNARKRNPFVRNPEIFIVKEKGKKMVKSKKTEASNSNRENPDVLERKRLKKLAITNNIVSDAQVKAPYSLNPSKTVAKHHGKDIIRKSQRKNRFLFSFPALLAPINGGGKIGELKDLSSKNPVLYLDFPQVLKNTSGFCLFLCFHLWVIVILVFVGGGMGFVNE